MGARAGERGLRAAGGGGGVGRWGLAAAVGAPPRSMSGRIVVKYAWMRIRSCGSSTVSRMMADVMIETLSPAPCTMRATSSHSMVGAYAEPSAPAM